MVRDRRERGRHAFAGESFNGAWLVKVTHTETWIDVAGTPPGALLVGWLAFGNTVGLPFHGGALWAVPKSLQVQVFADGAGACRGEATEPHRTS